MLIRKVRTCFEQDERRKPGNNVALGDVRKPHHYTDYVVNKNEYEVNA